MALISTRPDSCSSFPDMLLNPLMYLTWVVFVSFVPAGLANLQDSQL